MERVDGRSMDIVAQNIEKLREIFPEVFSEGRIDFEALEAVLGEYIDRDDERYSFTWKGKARARRIAQTPSAGTLRPAPEESKDWDTTRNLYIEGDNLEVLKLLQKSYHKKVKMIYIDPPYNTGKDFVYRDNFRDNLKNYLELTGQVDSEGRKLATNAETNGRYHSDWLSMMYPRLKLARNLLRDDGVIFISIDDNEVANLRKICDEIFGEENFVAEVIWKNKYNAGALTKGFSNIHEYILCYSKKELKSISVPLGEKEISQYKMKDSKYNIRGGYVTQPLATNSKDDRPNLRYPIVIDGEEVWPEKQWIWSKERTEEALRNDEIVVNRNNGKINLRVKQYLKDENGRMRTMKPLSILLGPFNQEGTKEVKELIGSKVFTFPKPMSLLHYLLSVTINENTDKDDLILDFFSGSATTAHAVMQLNAEDGGNRRYILVQLPEPTDEKSEAYKAGYKNICEIGKERIRRAGEKILQDGGLKMEDGGLDVGFKVFKLDSSNIKAWDPDYDDLEQSLLESVDNIKPDRTPADLLYEILLKYGLDLALPIEELELAGKKVYVVSGGSLVVCLDERITLDVVEEIAKLKEKYGADDLMRIVFRDNGFKDAEVKTNAIQILKQFGIEDVKSL